jgi:transposase
VVSTPRKNKEKRENKSFYKEKQGKYTLLKEQKAKIILSRENGIQELDPFRYLVQSQTGIGSYQVQWNGKRWVCNCPDFVKNGHIQPCKHAIAIDLYHGIGNVHDDAIKEITPVKYSQEWSMYNAAQVQEFELFDQFLYQLVSLIDEPKRQGPGRPLLKFSDQLFCCIMKVYSQLSSRRAKHLYHDALLRQQISHYPHFNAVSKTLNKPEITPILHELVRLSAQPLASIEADFAVDSSGFRCSTFGEYCSYAHGTSRVHNWLKVHISTGVYTNTVADVIITDEHGADSPQFKKLIKNTARYFNIHEVSADAAYSSRKNLEIVSKYGGTAYIPFRKNATGGSRGSLLWKRAYHYFQLHKDEFMEHYHKRSNAESTFSAIKKKLGETLKSKNRTAQINEMLCKIIAYNITVVIREMIEFGFDTKFLSLNDLQKEEILKQSNGFGDTGGKIDGV